MEEDGVLRRDSSYVTAKGLVMPKRHNSSGLTVRMMRTLIDRLVPGLGSGPPILTGPMTPRRGRFFAFFLRRH